MPHQIRTTHAGVLHRLEFSGAGATLAGQAEHGAVFCLADQRHDVVQKGAAFLHLAVHFHQVLVIDAGDQYRVDFGEHAACREHLQAQHLALVQNLCRCHAGDALVLPEYPRVNLCTNQRIDRIDGDGDMVHLVFADFIDPVRQRQAVG